MLKKYFFIVTSIICLSAPAQSAQLAYWNELRALAHDLGAVSHLDKICGTEDGPPIPWRNLFIEVQSDPLLTGSQQKLLATIYSEGRNSHGDVYASCTQNAVKLLLALSEKSLSTLQKLTEDYAVEDIAPVLQQSQ